MKLKALITLFFVSILCSDTTLSLFSDLEKVDKIESLLPFIYNHNLVGGYLAMPSARMQSAGTMCFGATSAYPYTLYSAAIQPFSQLELSANYRIFKDQLDGAFGHLGFGNYADRIPNAKLQIIGSETNALAIGVNDFYGSRHFLGGYAVATKEIPERGLELSLGYGFRRPSGLFGGVAWTPINGKVPLTLLAEYDATPYKNEPHKKGRKVKSPVNFGVCTTLFDALSLQAGYIKGRDISFQASIAFNLGQMDGVFPKVNDPPLCLSVIDTSPRSLEVLKEQLASEFLEQGLPLFDFGVRGNHLFVRVENVAWRTLEEVRQRSIGVLVAYLPSNITCATVTVDVEGVTRYQYMFRQADLVRFANGQISSFELKTLSPMKEASPFSFSPKAKKRLDLQAGTRLLSFFGSTKGKVKSTLSLIGEAKGHLPSDIYYKVQLSYNALSNAGNVGDIDFHNPSKLPNVRTQQVRYYQKDTLSLEEGYLQKSHAFGNGWYGRIAGGYFETAYGGSAAQILFAPVNSQWAIGFETALLFRRNFTGLGFTRKIRRLDGRKVFYEDFIGKQAFVDLYYDLHPLELQVSAGRFLAGDLGARVELSRVFSNGTRFSFWCTATNGGDFVNGARYFDKGVSFSIPLDFLLKKSSRKEVGYAMSAWSRDVGARAFTGKPISHRSR